MRCRNCGHVNPEENNYCGKCGKLLLPAFSEIREAVLARRPAAAEAATTRPEPVPPVPPKEARLTPKETREDYALAAEEEDGFAEEAPKRAPAASSPSLGGPSFLGLSGPTEDGSFTYLLEDEEPRSHTGRRLLLVLLAVAVGVAAWQWRSVSDFVIVTVMPYLQGTVNPGAKAPASAGNGATTPADSAQPTSAEVAEAPTSANAPAGAAPGASATDSKDSAQPASANPPADQDQAAQAGASKSPEQPQAEENQQKKQAEAANAETPVKPARSARKTHTPAPVKSAKSATPENEKEAEPDGATAQDRESETLLATGEKYLYGRGAPRDCQRALIYMQAAAEKDNAGALSHLGAMYSTGECVPLDRTKAYGFFSRALQLDRSNTYLERNLTMLWREMSDTERQNILRTRRQ